MFKPKIKGATTAETLENISYLLIIISVVCVAAGIGLGSFAHGMIYLGVIGAALFLPGIIIFVISQLLSPPGGEHAPHEGKGPSTGGTGTA